MLHLKSMKNKTTKSGTKRNKNELSPEDMKFVEAVVNSDISTTATALIAELCISRKKFYALKNKLEGVILERSRQLFRSEVPSWFKSLSRQAKKGDVQALRLALEMSREYIPFSKSEIEAKINPQINVTIMDSDVPDTHSDNNQP